MSADSAYAGRPSVTADHPDADVGMLHDGTARPYAPVSRSSINTSFARLSWTTVLA